ncbi:uncharacterized protein LOC126562712 [Anopheles maculipalpis]|uniref:uncharacterized protein LOC126562712 n=1 Tax=Anopheles maculipalpis TaxID=1496333 RepID=UPI002159B5AB|nr:uncharacterized protein LOC126562712 [Anopheles maculipalpis]
MSENTESDDANSSDSVANFQPQTLSHQMVLFFYRRQAIARDSWDISFWEMFRTSHPAVGLDAKALRSHFFHAVMQKASELEGLPYAVTQYINPLFNRIREDVLEFRDLVEGTDYVYNQDPNDVPTVSDGNTMPPLNLHPTCRRGNRASTSRSSKRYIDPSPEQVRNFVAAELSEILWTEEERSTQRSSLSISECLLRMALLTKKQIPLISCIEPGMACYDRLRKAGLVEACDEDDGGDGPQSDTDVSTPRFQQAGAASTPIAQTTHQQLYSESPAIGSIIRKKNYDSILKHVRSKPRRGGLK